MRQSLESEAAGRETTEEMRDSLSRSLGKRAWSAAAITRKSEACRGLDRKVSPAEAFDAIVNPFPTTEGRVPNVGTFLVKRSTQETR